MLGELGVALVGPEGDVEVPKLAALTVIYCVAAPTTGADVTEEGLPLSVSTAVIDCAALGIATLIFSDAGGAFWCGFQSDGTNHASNVLLDPQYGLKTSLLKYGRFLIPASS